MLPDFEKQIFLYKSYWFLEKKYLRTNTALSNFLEQILIEQISLTANIIGAYVVEGFLSVQLLKQMRKMRR